MIRVSKILLKAPEAFEGGRSGAEPTKKTNPTAIPGGKASTPSTSSSSQEKAPSCGKRDPDHGGMTYDTKTGGMVQSKILAQWITVSEDQVEDFEVQENAKQ